MAKITSLLEARQALYAAIEHQVDTTGLTIAEVAEKIAELYKG